MIFKKQDQHKNRLENKKLSDADFVRNEGKFRIGIIHIGIRMIPLLVILLIIAGVSLTAQANTLQTIEKAVVITEPPYSDPKSTDHNFPQLTCDIQSDGQSVVVDGNTYKIFTTVNCQNRKGVEIQPAIPADRDRAITILKKINLFVNSTEDQEKITRELTNWNNNNDYLPAQCYPDMENLCVIKPPISGSEFYAYATGSYKLEGVQEKIILIVGPVSIAKNIGAVQVPTLDPSQIDPLENPGSGQGDGEVLPTLES